MIGIGVIGAGYWGPNLMRNFAVLEDCRLRSVCDLSQERLASVERNHPGVAVTGRLQDILEGDEIQGVAIATPVHSHFELASRVVAAGKSVLVEKPLA